LGRPDSKLTRGRRRKEREREIEITTERNTKRQYGGDLVENRG
jgi:hypothetical protein